jgi:two-component system OmpR family sensor kinase
MAKIKIRIRRPWIPYIIFIVTLTLSLLTTYYISKETYTEDRLRFFNAVEDTTINIETRLQTYIALLRGAAGFFAAEHTVNQQQFASFVSRLNLQKNYPGTQGIGYIQIVTDNEKDNFIQSVQDQNNENFTVKPSGDRSVYYVVRYFVRRDKLVSLNIGDDVFVNTTMRSAMENARDSGTSVTSGKIIMTPHEINKNEAGFIIFTPIYSGGTIPTTIDQRRANIIGFVYSPFQINTLLNGILGNKHFPQLLNYQIYDGTHMNNTTLLHDSRTTTNQNNTNFLPRFNDTRHIDITGRTWTIAFTNHPEFEVESQKDLPFLIFVIGLLVSLMFFMLSRSQYIARTNAEIAALRLQHSQRELQKAINHRDNFISIASHELKTPLTSLKVYAEVLLRQFEKKGDNKTAEYLRKMNRQIDKLNLLIQDLLDVSRIQTNQLTFRTEKFDINDMAKEVIENTQQITDHHHITLVGSIKKRAWGDKDRISQVLMNLLTNAIKYSPHAKKVIVTLKETKQYAIITVRDFGIGINKDHQKKIFDRFYRINGTNEQTFPGLGIGLFISQAIVKRHGGEILIKSTQGKGSTFSFTIPFGKKQT